MKKSGLLLAVVVFLAVVWGGTTYIVGNKAENYYRNLLGEASRFGFVTFNNTTYERGFLQSRAITLMQIEFPVVSDIEDAMTENEKGETENSPVDLPGQTIELEFEHVFHHGPFPFTSGPASRFGFAPAIALVETSLTRFSPDQKALDNLLDEIPELNNTIDIARIDFDGTTHSLLEIPPFETTLEEGQLKFGGFNSRVDYSLLSGAMTGTYAMQRLVFDMGKGGSMTWKGLTGEFDLKRVLPLLYVGLSKAAVGGMEMNFSSFETGEPESIIIENLEMISNSRLDGQMVHLEQDTLLASITLEGEKYGPFYLETETKNLDAQALSDFQQQIIDVFKNSSKLDPDTITASILPLYLELFGKLLAGDPEMNILKFTMITPHGEANGNFSLKFIGIDDVTADDPMMLLQYVKNIDSSANLAVAEKLVKAIMLEKAMSDIKRQIALRKLLEQDYDLTDEQVEAMAIEQYEQQLEMLIAQKYLVREGEQLKTSMTFEDGELTVNGKKRPILQ